MSTTPSVPKYKAPLNMKWSTNFYINKRNDVHLHKRLEVARKSLERSQASNWQVKSRHQEQINTKGAKYNSPHNKCSLMTQKKFDIKAR
jgi:hypothetical protein